MNVDKIIKDGLVFERKGLTVNIWPEGQERTSSNTETHTIAKPDDDHLLEFIEMYFAPEPEEDKDELQEQRQAEIDSDSINEDSSADEHYPGD